MRLDCSTSILSPLPNVATQSLGISNNLYTTLKNTINLFLHSLQRKLDHSLFFFLILSLQNSNQMHFSIIFRSSSNALLKNNFRLLRIFFGYYLFFMDFRRRNHGHICFCIDEAAKIQLFHPYQLSSLIILPFLMPTLTARLIPKLHLYLAYGQVYVDLDPILHNYTQALLQFYCVMTIELLYHSSKAIINPKATAKEIYLILVIQLLQLISFIALVHFWQLFLSSLQKNKQFCSTQLNYKPTQHNQKFILNLRILLKAVKQDLVLNII